MKISHFKKCLTIYCKAFFYCLTFFNLNYLVHLYFICNFVSSKLKKTLRVQMFHVKLKKMKTINQRFVEMVKCGYREGRKMSDMDFFEMLNPKHYEEFKVMDWTPLPSEVATVRLSDKETYFDYKIVLQYIPDFGYRFICVYWSRRRWTVRCVYSNLFDVLNSLYDGIF